MHALVDHGPWVVMVRPVQMSAKVFYRRERETPSVGRVERPGRESESERERERDGGERLCSSAACSLPESSFFLPVSFLSLCLSFCLASLFLCVSVSLVRPSKAVGW